MEAMLAAVAAGELGVDEACRRMRTDPFTDLGYAKVDNHRGIRQGVSEIVYGAGKTSEHIAGICSAMLEAGQSRVLITRLDHQKAEALAGAFDIDYREEARLGIIGGLPRPDGNGCVVVACAGTSDMPVAEEAAVTAEMLGSRVKRVYDVGVSGIHRLFAYTEDIMAAQVIVAVAGMEGALPSVIAGLASCPVIAVPTSIGYGASLGGVAALLAMLNSCASGISVVNIDNGFGAGYLASMINHIGVK